MLLLGGASEIGLAVARRLAGDGAGRSAAPHVVLAGRRPTALDAGRSALIDAGATSVSTMRWDADDLASHRPLLDAVIADHGPIGTAVVAFGILGDQARAERDADHAVAILHTDFVAQAALLTHLAAVMRSADTGQIVVFSSIAGARVRRANYVYGSAKAGLDGFASGLGTALAGTGVSLLLVRPGFVVGRMTEGMARAPLSSTPDQVADATVEALRRGRPSVWVPARLGWLATASHLLPASLWGRMPR